MSEIMSRDQLFNIMRQAPIVKIRSKAAGYSVCLYQWDYANENYQVYHADYADTLDQAQALEQHYINLFADGTE